MRADDGADQTSVDCGKKFATGPQCQSSVAVTADSLGKDVRSMAAASRAADRIRLELLLCVITGLRLCIFISMADIIMFAIMQG